MTVEQQANVGLGVSTAEALSLWCTRLGISERIRIDLRPSPEVDDQDQPLYCRMLPAAIFPEAQGRWDFVLEVYPDAASEDLSRLVLHECVHLMLEPLRETYFKSAPLDPSYKVTVGAGTDSHQLILLADAIRHGGQLIAVRPDEPLLIERLIPEASVTLWETVIERIAHAIERSYP